MKFFLRRRGDSPFRGLSRQRGSAEGEAAKITLPSLPLPNPLLEAIAEGIVYQWGVTSTLERPQPHYQVVFYPGVPKVKTERVLEAMRQGGYFVS